LISDSSNSFRVTKTDIHDLVIDLHSKELDNHLMQDKTMLRCVRLQEVKHQVLICSPFKLSRSFKIWCFWRFKDFKYDVYQWCISPFAVVVLPNRTNKLQHENSSSWNIKPTRI